jgi:predicted flap endonuclease-1-like 5' DNA nuclease
MAKLVDIEGIGDTYALKLREAGVETTEKLLDMGASPKGRQEIAEITGISERLILNWVNRADLLRIKGVGEEYAYLLEATGIDTVRELAQRSSVSLFRKMAEMNEEKYLVRKLPTEKQVDDWIAQARALPRTVTY